MVYDMFSTQQIVLIIPLHISNFSQISKSAMEQRTRLFAGENGTAEWGKTV